MGEILGAVNVLPRSVVFIDDNPAERAAMQAAFPDIRVLGSHPYYLRRTLLLAPELQGAGVTAESARRTEMIRAQAVRDMQREGFTNEAFLAQQDTAVRLDEIASTDAPRFARAFELLNKTNQFNTTGQRWTRRECAAHFAQGGVFVVFDVADRFADYGLVGVVILRHAHIVQWVMSCRVIGMAVEQAVMAALVSQMRAGDDARMCAGDSGVSAAFVETDANLPCRSLYSGCGFVHDGNCWTLPAQAVVPIPAYVKVNEV